jgi:hypothetical protein
MSVILSMFLLLPLERSSRVSSCFAGKYTSMCFDRWRSQVRGSCRSDSRFVFSFLILLLFFNFTTDNCGIVTCSRTNNGKYIHIYHNQCIYI